ncbi:hypothetical protein BRE01_51890 [Brevibacillus reuszeri]|uniref:Uncharacterized protein n=1 Tax=Brevibacillus reuszeri TaxID=54915 RepID=A0A0K9YJZ5_9BACL|nr:DUF6583 family protein [Brevibacillus reuszeri]KNB68972.1 hypothetical protein ADS79_31115 [Brevibacillus reuszeri]MED1859397.1 hypothetical protein [Brevibacillus reuszeri]GED71487.1 hypothetical protein BRE01_51890 [Brevibacillus reuszeri]
METTPSLNTPRKSMKKTLLIAGAAVVVVLGGLGTAYAKFDLFKSAKSVYLQSEAESMMKFSADASKAYGEYEAYMKPYLEKPVHSTTELSEITVDATIPDPQAQKILDMLKSAKLVMQSNIDEQKNQQSGNFEVHLQDKKLATIEYFLNDTLMGFRLPEFYSKYGYIDLKDRDAVKEKLGEELPKRFLTYRDLYTAVAIKEDEVKSIVTPYAMLYASNIKDSQVTMNKEASFSEEGLQANVRELTVTFNQEEATTLVKQLAEKAKADEKLFDLIYSRYHNVSTLMKDSGYPVEEISKDEFKKNYDKSFDDLLADITQTDKNSKDQIKMVVLVDGDHQILSRKLIVNEDNKDDTIWTSVAYSKGADTYYRYTLNAPEEGKEGELSFTYKATEQNGKKAGKVDILIKETKDPVLDFSTTFEVTKQDKKETGVYDFKLVAEDEYSAQPITLSGNVTLSETATENGRDSEGSIKFNFDNPTPDMPKGVSMKLKSKQEFGKALEIPAMSEANAINLATITDQQMMEIQQEAGMALEKFMAENEALVQQFMMP